MSGLPRYAARETPTRNEAKVGNSHNSFPKRGSSHAAAPRYAASREDAMNKTIVRCHGCDGKGWIQVIDPPVYELRVGSSNTDLGGGPQTISHGTARGQLCPLCGGAGGLTEGSVPPKPAR